MRESRWIPFAEGNANDLELNMRSPVTPRNSAEVVQAPDGAQVMDCPHQRGRFADREFLMLRMIAFGNQVSQIAKDLSLSVATVSAYRARSKKWICRTTPS